MSKWIACKTPGCTGDGRYMPPGRGHIEGCTNPMTPPPDTPAGARLSEQERLRLARAVYSVTGFHPPKGAYDLSSVPSEIEHAVERILAARLAAHDAPGLAEAVLREAVETQAAAWSAPESHRNGAWLRERDAADILRALLAAHPPTAPEPSAGADGLVRLLAEHWAAGMAESDAAHEWECVCGQPIEMSDEAHRAHVAAVLTRAGYGLVDAGTEGPREAVGALVDRLEHAYNAGDVDSPFDMLAWLRADLRAALDGAGQ